MKIIIDGYNLIGSEGGLRGDIEQKRAKLIKALIAYKADKGHALTVVFDGHRGENHYESVERTGGISVVYSRIGETADSVIIRMAMQEGSSCVVVSSDREIRSSVSSSGAVSIGSGEFSNKLAAASGHDYENGPDEFDEEAYYSKSAKKGNPRKLSKIDRIRQRTLSKL